MNYCKGVVARVIQHGGCLEVVVEGECPGAFAVDNLMVPFLLDPDGPGLLGRKVEHEDGSMRFCDEENSPSPESARSSGRF